MSRHKNNLEADLVICIKSNELCSSKNKHGTNGGGSGKDPLRGDDFLQCWEMTVLN